MLYINKTCPPRNIQDEIDRVRRTPEWHEASVPEQIRDCFDQLDKNAIREALIREQHSLCAYCMHRIYNDGNSTTIEHRIPLSRDRENALNFGNMLGVCDGGSHRTIKCHLCCDRAKGNTPITLDPTRPEMIACIFYRDGGKEIYYKGNDNALSDTINREINRILFLNGVHNRDGSFKSDTATMIVKGRSDAFKCYLRIVGKAKIDATYLRSQIRNITESDEYPEYAGVILFYLRRKLRTMEHNR